MVPRTFDLDYAAANLRIIAREDAADENLMASLLNVAAYLEVLAEQDRNLPVVMM